MIKKNDLSIRVYLSRETCWEGFPAQEPEFYKYIEVEINWINYGLVYW